MRSSTSTASGDDYDHSRYAEELAWVDSVVVHFGG